MNSNQSGKVDVLDILIATLREHEKHLDEAVEKLAAEVTQLSSPNRIFS